jgi:hypothetical protein
MNIERLTARVQGLAATVFLLAFTASAAAAPIVIQPDDGKDAEINSGSPGSNLGSNEFLTLNWINNFRSIGLVEFDLSSIAPGSVINSAQLSLFHQINTQSNAQYDIFRVTSPWLESTVTFNTAPSFDPIAVSSLTFSGNPGVRREWDVTAVVQGWVSGAFANYGLWIEEIPVQGAATAYFSSSDGLSGREPRLTVDATAAVPEPMSLLLMISGLGGALLHRRRMHRD